MDVCVLFTYIYIERERESERVCIYAYVHLCLYQGIPFRLASGPTGVNPFRIDILKQAGRQGCTEFLMF